MDIIARGRNVASEWNNEILNLQAQFRPLAITIWILFFTFPISYITNIGTVVTKYCLFYMIPIRFLLLIWVFPLLDILIDSLSHRFTFSHSAPTRMLYHISYYMEAAIMNKGTVVTKYCFVLLDTSMAPISWYLTISYRRRGDYKPIFT